MIHHKKILFTFLIIPQITDNARKSTKQSIRHMSKYTIRKNFQTTIISYVIVIRCINQERTTFLS